MTTNREASGFNCVESPARGSVLLLFLGVDVAGGESPEGGELLAGGELPEEVSVS